MIERLTDQDRVALRQIRGKYARKAGRAVPEYGEVNERLTAAIDFFANEDWSNGTLEDFARVGGQIERTARQLIAAARVEQIDLMLKTGRRDVAETRS